MPEQRISGVGMIPGHLKEFCHRRPWGRHRVGERLSVGSTGANEEGGRNSHNKGPQLLNIEPVRGYDLVSLGVWSWRNAGAMDGLY